MPVLRRRFHFDALAPTSRDARFEASASARPRLRTSARLPFDTRSAVLLRSLHPKPSTLRLLASGFCRSALPRICSAARLPCGMRRLAPAWPPLTAFRLAASCLELPPVGFPSAGCLSTAGVQWPWGATVPRWLALRRADVERSRRYAACASLDVSSARGPIQHLGGAISPPVSRFPARWLAPSSLPSRPGVDIR